MRLHTRIGATAALLAAVLVLSHPAIAQTSTTTATAPACTQGVAGVAPTATLTFTAPTTNTDGTPVATPLTYEVFMGPASGKEVLLSKGNTTSPIVVNGSLVDGNTYYFYIETVAADGEVSAPSNEACKTFPPGVPGTVVIKIT